MFTSQVSRSTGPEGSGRPTTTSGPHHLEACYRLDFAEVRAYIARRLGSDDADDIAADVFLAATRACLDGRAEQVTTAWLMTVARYKVIDHWRRHGRHRAAMMRLHHRVEDAGADPETDACDRIDVAAALCHCPEDHRQVLWLRYAEGRSAADTGEILGRSAPAVDSLAARARRNLRGADSPDGVRIGRGPDMS